MDSRRYPSVLIMKLPIFLRKTDQKVSLVSLESNVGFIIYHDLDELVCICSKVSVKIVYFDIFKSPKIFFLLSQTCGKQNVK